MSNVIDIERLVEMPITDELSELLFWESSYTKHISIEKGFDFITYKLLVFGISERRIRISRRGDIKSLTFDINGVLSVCAVYNAFQIVRYIDKYLNSGKSDVEKLLQEIHDSIHIGIVPVEDTDNIMFGTIKKLAEKYL